MPTPCIAGLLVPDPVIDELFEGEDELLGVTDPNVPFHLVPVGCSSVLVPKVLDQCKVEDHVLAQEPTAVSIVEAGATIWAVDG